jgi:transcriptional regulator with XRE-family HTH domain
MLDKQRRDLVYIGVAKTTVTESVYAEIGERIERLRNRKRLSQSQLAGRLQKRLTRAAISNIESGRQRLLVHVLLDIARALDVEPAEILAMEPPPPPHPVSIDDELTNLPASTETISLLRNWLVSNS